MIHLTPLNKQFLISNGSLIRILAFSHDFSLARLSAAGYAEYHPAGSNDTPEGRARNRRVDIVVLNPTVLERVPEPNK